MKTIILFCLLLITLSCVSTKYNFDKTPGDFSKIKAGEKYKIYDLNNQKSVISVISIKKDSIIGTYKNQRISLAKTDIKSIKKNKTGASVVLVGAAAGVIIISTVILKGVKDTAEKFGDSLPPL